ncbi:amino acid ABC transporter permease [Microbacterium amylolyticum]|uniref:Glutamate transport system permease protein n=1 Tax=Microbacterium amylolyticum TaxID=936337 RepID=A0ABS4ZFS1_9MICO|nr:amino acid ABC transporter permease [Microbacterium amylolyticum]MBP2436119.1 glutamate transport system permease protein [Microbacterium amylolyticum]
MTSVLYDLPGPRAIIRNRIIGVVTVLVVLGILGFVIWRFTVTGQFASRRWELFTYTTVWMSILRGLGATLSAFAVAAVGSLVLGFALAVGRLSHHGTVRYPSGAVTEVMRAVPVLIGMMLLYYGLPVIGVAMTPYWAVVIALIAYNGSVIAEAIRAGIVSLPTGQSEAGYAIGLRKSGVMTFILMPQAVRAMMPVIIAQLVVCLKDTALGFIITYPELLYIGRQLGSNMNFGSPIIPTTLVIGTIYIGLCILLSYVAFRVEKQMRSSPKVRGVVAAANPRAHEGATVTSVIAKQDPRASL